MKKIGCLFLAMLFLLLCCGAGMAEDIWICPSCYAQNTMLYCTRCGTRRPDDIVCPSCGTHYLFNSRAIYCGACGNLLVVEEPEAVSSSFSLSMDFSKTAFTGPEEITVTIGIQNTGERDTSPIELFYPDGRKIEEFGSPVLAPGESKQWTGTWSVTESELKNGKLRFSLRYQKDSGEKDENGSPILVERVTTMANRLHYEPPVQIMQSDLLETLEEFYRLWSQNDMDGMLMLCDPEWKDAQDYPKNQLFMYMQNRTPKSITVKNISGTVEDTSRTVELVVQVDRNNGKPIEPYVCGIRMVRKGDAWYVDPTSMTFEPVEPDPTPTPAPTPEPTSEPVY